MTVAMEPVQALLLVLVAVASLCPAIAVEVQVLPDLASDCSSSSDNSGETLSAVNIDTALMNTRSNTTLLLENGCYLINSSALLQDLSNISLIGSGSETTIVKCQSDWEVGLAFVNISGLRLSDVTISNCSLYSTGVNLQKAFSLLQQSLDVFYSFRVSTIVGVFIGDTSDLQARNVMVRNTPGIGMVAINLMGTSDMSNVTFINNGVPGITNCVGGGLYILYADYHNYTPTVMPKLTMSASLFKMNSNCNSSIFEYWFGLAGGLSFILSQTKFSVGISITSAIIENNISPEGAGAGIVCHTGVSGSSVNISSSILRKNGRNGIGGGLLMVLNANVQFLRNASPAQILPNTIIMENTTIEENRARLFGGAVISSFNSPLVTRRNQNRVIFKSCRFLRNLSPTGAAFAFQSFIFSGFDPSMSIIFDDVSIEQNREISTSLITYSTVRSIAILNSVNLTIRGKSKFVKNGPALLLTDSILTIEGELHFIDNAGSGISLNSLSSIVLQSGSRLFFVGNKAASKGGAIFVELRSSFSDSSLFNDCFLWFEEVTFLCRFLSFCQNVPQPNATIVFEDNQAPNGGTIYGSRLSTCPWAVYANGTRPSSGIAFLEQLPSVTFKPPLHNPSVVSTDAFYLVRNTSQPIFAVPGKEMNLNITALDLFNQSVSTTIRSVFLNSTSSQSQLGNSGNWYLIPNRTVPVTFLGEPGDTLLASIFTEDSNARVELTVTLENCSFGFFLNGNQRCLCDQDLPSLTICDQQNFQLQFPSHMWLGNSPTGGFAYASCVFDYCKVGTKNISDGDIDSQCQPEYNRSGLLCASCVSNTSVVFGSNACRTCSNAWLAFIIVFAVFGIVLVLAISFLGFSISEGYLNSLLFYCNVTSFYSSFFAPNISRGFILVKFINLSLGFELCFYDGMDTLAKVGIQLLFPAYLFVIMIVIIILAKYSSKISNAGFSAAKTFSTLLLLCYTSVVETCIQIVAGKTINGINGTFWYADPIIPYGQGFHGFLVFVAVVLILFYILPFSIALLLPPLILRTRLSIMLKPLLDAFWNPFKPKFRFWLGLRAILRIIPYGIAVSTPFPTNCFLLINFIVLLLFFHVCFQPFEGKWQNILDVFFYLHLFLLSAGALFFRSITLDSINNVDYLVFLSIVLSLSSLAFFLIVAVHINIRFPVIRKTTTKLFQRLKEKVKKQKCETDNPIATQQNESMATFSELREPVLDSDFY